MDDRRSSGPMPCRRPLCTQILAHVERSGHFVAGDLTGKDKGDRIAVGFAECASYLNLIAVDRAGEIARNELTLMRAIDRVRTLTQMQRVRRAAGSVLDAHVPFA